MADTIYQLKGVGDCVKGVTYNLDSRPEIEIGRGPENQINLWRRPDSAEGDYQFVSRRHCRLQRESASWILFDRGSANGTEVIDGASKQPSSVPAAGHPIRANDIIRPAGCDHFNLMLIEVEPPPPIERVQSDATFRVTASAATCVQLFQLGSPIASAQLESELYLTGEGSLWQGGIAVPGVPTPGPFAQISLNEEDHFELAADPDCGILLTVNHQRLTGCIALHHGDLIGFPASPQLSLLFLDPAHAEPRQLSDLLLDEDEITIGRAEDGVVRLPHPSVSRLHARLRRAGTSLLLTDLGSASGTFVDGQRLQAHRELQLPPGAALRFGTVAFVADPGCWKATAPSPRVDVAVSGLSFSSQGKTILHPLTLRFPEGHLVGIMGPSGSGKSTLLELIAGRRPASSGKVYANGRILHSHRGFSRYFRDLFGYVPEVAFVSQLDAVPENLTLGEILTDAALGRGLSPAEAEACARQRAEDCSLLDHWRQIVRPRGAKYQLSGGQLKRLCVAQQLILEPKVLVLDEPATGLDPKTSDSLTQLFRSIAQQGATVLMSTHEVENLALCHLVAVIALGHLVYYGPPQLLPQHFGCLSLRDCYRLLPDQEAQFAEAEALALRFEQTGLYRTYCQQEAV